jgi:hypothetical protein
MSNEYILHWAPILQGYFQEGILPSHTVSSWILLQVYFQEGILRKCPFRARARAFLGKSRGLYVSRALLIVETWSCVCAGTGACHSLGVQQVAKGANQTTART